MEASVPYDHSMFSFTLSLQAPVAELLLPAPRQGKLDSSVTDSAVQARQAGVSLASQRAVLAVTGL